MSILVNKQTRIIVHGVGHEAGRLHAAACRAYGHGRRCVAAAVAPELAGRTLDGIPIFGKLTEARAATGATACDVHAPGDAMAGAIEEAAEAGMALIVCVAEGDASAAGRAWRSRLNGSDTRLLGPGCAGVVTPGEVRIGSLVIDTPQRGRIGIVSRAAAWVPDVASQLAQYGLGASTLVSLPAPPHAGLSHLELLRMFNEDPGTDAVLLLGGLEADDEEACAAWLVDHMHKPVAAFMDDRAGTRLESCGVHVTRDARAVGSLTASLVDSPWLPFD